MTEDQQAEFAAMLHAKMIAHRDAGGEFQRGRYGVVVLRGKYVAPPVGYGGICAVGALMIGCSVGLEFRRGLSEPEQGELQDGFDFAPREQGGWAYRLGLALGREFMGGGGQ